MCLLVASGVEIPPIVVEHYPINYSCPHILLMNLFVNYLENLRIIVSDILRIWEMIRHDKAPQVHYAAFAEAEMDAAAERVREFQADRATKMIKD